MTKYLVTVSIYIGYLALDWGLKSFRFLESGSQKFEDFLTLLGEKIRLKGWDKYRGGLDVKGSSILS